MAAEDQQQRVDAAFDRIEGTILPCIGLMLESLLDAADADGGLVKTEAYAHDLRRLATQLEALTREIESAKPMPSETRKTRSAAA